MRCFLWLGFCCAFVGAGCTFCPQGEGVEGKGCGDCFLKLYGTFVGLYKECRCPTALAPSGRQLHCHGCPFSQILNHQLCDAKLPQTSWWRRVNVTVIGHYMMTSFTLLHFAWNCANHCGGTIDVASRWREDWQSATVVNSTLVVDPTIRLPGFDLHRRQLTLLNRFRTGQDHVVHATRNGVSPTANCVAVERSMSHIVCLSIDQLTAVCCPCMKRMRLPSTGWQHMALSTR